VKVREFLRALVGLGGRKCSKGSMGSKGSRGWKHFS